MEVVGTTTSDQDRSISAIVRYSSLALSREYSIRLDEALLRQELQRSVLNGQDPCNEKFLRTFIAVHLRRALNDNPAYRVKVSPENEPQAVEMVLGDIRRQVPEFKSPGTDTTPYVFLGRDPWDNMRVPREEPEVTQGATGGTLFGSVRDDQSADAATTRRFPRLSDWGASTRRRVVNTSDDWGRRVRGISPASMGVLLIILGVIFAIGAYRFTVAPSSMFCAAAAIAILLISYGLSMATEKVLMGVGTGIVLVMLASVHAFPIKRIPLVGSLVSGSTPTAPVSDAPVEASASTPATPPSVVKPADGTVVVPKPVLEALVKSIETTQKSVETANKLADRVDSTTPAEAKAIADLRQQVKTLQQQLAGQKKSSQRTSRAPSARQRGGLPNTPKGAVKFNDRTVCDDALRKGCK